MASRSVVPPELFYCVAKDPEFISFAKSRMVGSSGRQRFSAEDIAMYPIVIAPDEVYLKVQPLLRSFMDQVRTIGFESRSLAATRDALLPKLMSGEIDVEKVKVA
jgi:type I restriction enzyme S subunit